MRGRKRRSFDFGNFEITKREILVSVSIVAIMLLIGVLIAGKISDYCNLTEYLTKRTF